MTAANSTDHIRPIQDLPLVLHATADYSETSAHGLSPHTMEHMPFSVAIAEVVGDDYPLVYVNRAFETLTGYHRSSAIGRNCRFLQGSETSSAHRQLLRDALAARREVSVDIINYRANGERFLNRVQISMIAAGGKETTHFLAIQTELAEDLIQQGKLEQLDQNLREVQHRVKNHLSMLLALIQLESNRAGDDRRGFDVLAHRVETLNLLYDELSLRDADLKSSVDLGAYITRVASALNMLDGKRDVIVNVGAQPFQSPVEAASRIGLLVSELLTNALRHAFVGDETGTVDLHFWVRAGKAYVQVSDNGKGLPDDCDWPKKGNLGAKIVSDLTRGLEAELLVVSSPRGTQVTVAIPLSVFRWD